MSSIDDVTLPTLKALDMDIFKIYHARLELQKE